MNVRIEQRAFIARHVDKKKFTAAPPQWFLIAAKQMYQDAVQAIHDHLVQKSLTSGLTYTAELIPERNQGGEL